MTYTGKTGAASRDGAKLVREVASACRVVVLDVTTVIILLLGFTTHWPVMPLMAQGTSQEDRVVHLVNEAFDHFYNLEYDRAIDIFQRLNDTQPSNPSMENHLATAYLYKQLYLAGLLKGDLYTASNRVFRIKKIQLDAELVNQFQQANQAAIRVCEQRLKQNARDEQALYDCGVAYGTRATYQGLIERSKLAALSSAHTAYGYHSQLLLIDPQYYDAYLVTGVYEYVLGSLPLPMRLLLHLAGLSGHKERGMEAAKTAAQQGGSAQYDAKIVLAVMYRREEKYADAERMLADLAHSFPRNPLFPLGIASTYRAAGQIMAAISKYEQVLLDIRQGKPGYQEISAAEVHYEVGELYREVGNLQSAQKHLEQVAGSRGSTPELVTQSTILRKEIEETLRRQQPRRRGSAE